MLGPSQPYLSNIYICICILHPQVYNHIHIYISIYLSIYLSIHPSIDPNTWRVQEEQRQRHSKGLARMQHLSSNARPKRVRSRPAWGLLKFSLGFAPRVLHTCRATRSMARSSPGWG